MDTLGNLAWRRRQVKTKIVVIGAGPGGYVAAIFDHSALDGPAVFDACRRIVSDG